MVALAVRPVVLGDLHQPERRILVFVAGLDEQDVLVGHRRPPSARVCLRASRGSASTAAFTPPSPPKPLSGPSVDQSNVAGEVGESGGEVSAGRKARAARALGAEVGGDVHQRVDANALGQHVLARRAPTSFGMRDGDRRPEVEHDPRRVLERVRCSRRRPVEETA